MSRELSKASGGASGSIIPSVKREQVLALDQLIKSSRAEIDQARADGNDMLIAFTLAEVTQQLRTQLESMLPDIKHLVGTPLGIEVYPPTAKYSDQVILDTVLEGLLKGMRLVGGEIGIHSARLYDTKKYWERMVRTYPGIVFEEPSLEKPNAVKFGEKIYASVEGSFSWRINGKADKLEWRGSNSIHVLWNNNMGMEAVHGKAKRVVYRAAYARITNTEIPDDDDVLDGEIVPTPEPLPAPEAAPPADAKQRVESFLQDVEGTLVSLDTVIDCCKSGDHFKRQIVQAQEAGDWTDGEAASLIKVVAGLVESRCTEIRKARGQRKAG